MPTKRRDKSPKEELLGEIETRVVGMQYYENVVTPGEQVNLERDRKHLG